MEKISNLLRRVSPCSPPRHPSRLRRSCHSHRRWCLILAAYSRNKKKIIRFWQSLMSSASYLFVFRLTERVVAIETHANGFWCLLWQQELFRWTWSANDASTVATMVLCVREWNNINTLKITINNKKDYPSNEHCELSLFAVHANIRFVVRNPNGRMIFDGLFAT